MTTAEIRRPFQSTDKRGQMPREPGHLIPVPACILDPPIIVHDGCLPPRSQRVLAVTVGVAG